MHSKFIPSKFVGSRGVLVAALILAAVLPTAAFAGGGSCPSLQASRLPQQVTSGAWSRDVLLLADPSRHKIFAFRRGASLGEVPNPVPTVGQFFPVKVTGRGRDVVIETEKRGGQRELLSVDQRYELLDQRTKPLPDRKVQSASTTDLGGLDLTVSGGATTVGVKATFIYAFADDDMIGCSDLEATAKDGSATWSSGIVRIPLESPNEFRAYSVSHFLSPEWRFCRLGLPYITSIGSDGYVLLFNQEPGIYRIRQGATSPEKLDGYPSDLLVAPTLPDFSGPEDFASVAVEMERSTMPYGLFSWEDSLFVLRHVVDRGERLWMLDKVDSATGEILGTVRVASSAKHLLLIPGPQFWAVVEKGDFVDFSGRKWPQVQDVRLLPSSRLDQDFSGVVCQ